MTAAAWFAAHPFATFLVGMLAGLLVAAVLIVQSAWRDADAETWLRDHITKGWVITRTNRCWRLTHPTASLRYHQSRPHDSLLRFAERHANQAD